MKKTKKALASLAIAGMVASMLPFNAFASTTLDRFAGVNRYQTASLIADQVGSPNKVAILTAGMDANLVDALAAAPFAASQKAPILLTSGSELDSYTAAELTKLAVNKVYITTGATVISKAVTDKLTEMNIAFEFVGGANRYETALNLAKKLSAPTGVVVASANDASMVDSLAVSSIAAANNMAIVLTNKDGMDANTKAYVKGLNVPTYVIGSDAVVADSVVTDLGATRVGGANRYATNVAVMNQFKSKISFDTAYAASGNDAHLVDALAGAPLAAQSKSAIVLADGTVSSEVSAFAATAGINNVVALGSENVVPEAVVSGIKAPVGEELKVTSVTAANLAKVVVVFNQPVDKDSAEDESNYDGITVANAQLQADKQTVNLYINDELNAGNTHLDNFEDYDVTVSGVKTLAGVEMDEVTFPISTKDTTVPTVLGVNAKGSQVVGVQFSEAVRNVSLNGGAGTNYTNLELDGDPIAFNDMNAVTSYNATTKSGETLTLSFKKALPAGEHTLTFIQGDANNANMIQDYAGYKLPPADYKFTVTSDYTAPTVSSVEVVDQSKVRVVFSEGMNISAVDDNAQENDFYWNSTGSKTNTTNHSDDIKKINDTTWEMSFKDNPLDEGKVYFFVKNVKDFSGNFIMGNVDAEIYKTELNVTANEAPKVEGVTVESDTELTVKFSTSMDQDTAEDTDNYVLKDADGEVIDIDNATLVDDEVTLTMSDVEGGTYTLEISGVEDVIGIEMASPQTYTLKITDTTQPSGVAAVATWRGDSVVIAFDETMATTGDYAIDNEDNYKIKNGGGAEADLPAGTDLTVLDNGKKVRITFPAGVVDATDHIVIGYFKESKVYTVADASGNLYTPDDLGALGAAAGALDVSAATSVKVKSATEVELVVGAGFDEVVASDFQLLINGHYYDVVDAELDADDDTNKTVILTIDADDHEIAAGENVQVFVKDLNPAESTDLYDIAITDNVTSAVGSSNDISPILESAIIMSPTQMAVTFDSAIDTPALGALVDDLVITQGSKTWSGSSTIASVVAQGAVVDPKTVIVTIQGDDSFDIASEATVKTVSEDFIDAVGANGADIAENLTGIKSVSFGAVGFSSAGNVFTIDFNRAIDFDSIKDTDWDAAVTATAKVNADGEMEFTGANIGTIKGLTNVTAGTGMTVTLDNPSSKRLTITLTNDGTPSFDVTQDMVSFVASSKVKSSTGISASADVEALLTHASTLNDFLNPATFAITNPLVSAVAQDGVTFTDNATAAQDTIAFAAGSFVATDTVSIKVGAAAPINLVVALDGSVAATNIGDNNTAATVSAVLTITDAAGNVTTQTITLKGVGAALL